MLQRRQLQQRSSLLTWVPFLFLLVPVLARAQEVRYPEGEWLRYEKVEADPLVTSVPDRELEAFEGRWAYPPAALGMEPEEEIELWVEDGHLVGYFPTAGTFQLFLQPDGTFHQEDSRRTFVPVRNDDGSLAGIVDQRIVDRVSGSP